MVSQVSYGNDYSIYHISYYQPKAALDPVGKIAGIPPVNYRTGINVNQTEALNCQTCKNRKYVDGSTESNVSFKSPGHISPQASFALVSSHENEHVTNALKEGSKPDAELVSTSVSLKMAVCPECGTPYVSGGETRTQIKYDVKNPYENNRKALEESLLKGMHVDYVA